MDENVIKCSSNLKQFKYYTEIQLFANYIINKLDQKHKN
jgi:hypothetical protein